MLLKHKSVFFTLLIPLILFSSSYNAVATNNLGNFKVDSNQVFTSLSGNVTIMVLNFEAYYTSAQISKLNETAYSTLPSLYPGVNFNFTVVTDVNLPNSSFSQLLDEIITLNQPNYIIIIGAMTDHLNDQFTNVLDFWTAGDNYTNVKNIALVNYMTKSSDYNSYMKIDNSSLVKGLTLADFNLLQAGFMSGVKASLLTKSDKIGLILDHSLKVTFDYPLKSPLDEKGFSIYSLNRDNFVTGFIAGVGYGAEHLRNRANIEIKTEGCDLANLDCTSAKMTDNVMKLKDFGADTIFNMEPVYNEVFIQEAKSFTIQTGVLGYNDSNADYSFVLNNNVLVKDVLNQWNSSASINDLTYTLSNSTAMSLSKINDKRLDTIQTEILNGTIIIPVGFQNEGVPGFELFSILTFSTIVIFRKKLRHH